MGLKPRSFVDQSIVLRHGDPTSHVYLLVCGALEIVQRNPEGESVVVKILARPSLFGSIEALANETHYLETVRVLKSALIYTLDKSMFIELINKRPDLSLQCLSDISKVFCLAAKYEHAVVSGAKSRFSALLLAYAQLFGQAQRRGSLSKLNAAKKNWRPVARSPNVPCAVSFGSGAPKAISIKN